MKRTGVIAKGQKKGTSGGGKMGALKRIGGAALGGIPFIGGAASQIASELMSRGVPPAQAMRMAGGRRRRKGLTGAEIRGAVKVLRLVKRFAPAGSRAALRMRRRRVY